MRILTAILSMVLTGCSTTSVTRGPDGELTVTHSTFFFKTQAPSLNVMRENQDAYIAEFNAASRSGDVESMKLMMQLIQAGMITLPNGE